MKKRKRSKRKVWKMWMRFESGKPFITWPPKDAREHRPYGCDLRKVEIREAPKPKRRAKRCGR